MGKIDVTAVARAVGIDVQYRNLRQGAVLNLPQRLAVFAQGASAAVYSTDKFQATSSGAVGAKMGYGSPAHLIARQLLPLNGDGVGVVPVTFFPLTDHASGVAAAGAIAPTGSQTQAAQYRAAVNNILSEIFVVPVGASITTVCALIGAAIQAVLEMPVTVGYTYGTVTSSPAAGNTGDGTVTALSVVGAPTPGDYRLVCNTAVLDGGVFSLYDPSGNLIADDITMTPGPGGATVISEGGIQFTLTDAATDFVVGDEFTITVPATDVTLAAKWEGTTGDDLYVEVLGEDLGTTFTITQPTGGLANPAIDDALAQIGNVWETLGLNALGVDDSTALDAIHTFGEGRWLAALPKPIVVFAGNTAVGVSGAGSATEVSSTRRTDRTNAQLVAPGSKDLPFVVAARQLARIARVANNNPPTDYAGQRATGLTPGADSEQWDYAERDAAVKLGSSTIEVVGDEIQLSDTVTFYRPVGEEIPAYRFVVDIVKLQNAIFQFALEFESDRWKGKVLIPDDQATTNPNARKPKTAVAAAKGIIDGLGLAAIISDPATAKANTTAAIDSQNAKRLNLQTTIQLSGNTGIVDVGLNFGFFFGQPAIAA